MIEKDDLYKLSELINEDKLFSKKGLFWIRTKIHSGELKSINTAGEGKRPFYMVSGKDAIDFLSKFK